MAVPDLSSVARIHLIRFFEWSRQDVVSSESVSKKETPELFHSLSNDERLFLTVQSRAVAAHDDDGDGYSRITSNEVGLQAREGRDAF